MAPLTIPNTGSTVCFRKRQRDRPSPVAILARMRLGHSAFGSLAGLSAGGGRKSCARRRSSVPTATRTSRPRCSNSATSVPVAYPLSANARSGEPSAPGAGSTSAASSPRSLAQGPARLPRTNWLPPGARHRLGVAAPPMPAAPVPAYRRAVRIRQVDLFLRSRPFPRRLGPLPLAPPGPLVPRRHLALVLRALRRRPRPRPALQLRAGLVQPRLQRLAPPRFLRQALRIWRIPGIRALRLAQQAPGPAAQPLAQRHRPVATKAVASRPARPLSPSPAASMPRPWARPPSVIQTPPRSRRASRRRLGPRRRQRGLRGRRFQPRTRPAPSRRWTRS